MIGLCVGLGHSTHSPQSRGIWPAGLPQVRKFGNGEYNQYCHPSLAAKFPSPTPDWCPALATAVWQIPPPTLTWSNQADCHPLPLVARTTPQVVAAPPVPNRVQPSDPACGSIHSCHRQSSPWDEKVGYHYSITS